MTLPQRTVTLAIAISIPLLTGLMAARGQEAEPQPPAGARVAFVDISAVSNEYQALQKKDAELKAWLTGRHDYLVSLQDYIFLSEDNFNEVLAILDQPKPIPDDKLKRLDELAALSAQKEQTFRELESKVPRTTEEADQFSTLREGMIARQQQIRQLENDINEEYQKRVKAARDELMRNVEEVIAQYAQENGYDIVLDRAFVLYGGEDITRAIIDRLNPPAEAAPATGEATTPSATEETSPPAEESQPPTGGEAPSASEQPPAEETSSG